MQPGGPSPLALTGQHPIAALSILEGLAKSQARERHGQMQFGQATGKNTTNLKRLVVLVNHSWATGSANRLVSTH